MKRVVFVCMAQREFDFFLPTSEALKKDSIESTYVPFFEPGVRDVKAAGFEVFNFYDYLKQKSFKKNKSSISREEISKLILHEKVTFNVKKDNELVEKFETYYSILNQIFESILEKNKKDEIIVVQELGGFIANLTSYFVARDKNIQHYFLEPSFYKGRIVSVKNSLKAVRVPRDLSSQAILQEAVHYLSEALEKQTVVIPKKDVHHFSDMGIKKIFNPSNFKKISKKLYYKYILNEKQEYDQIYNHTKRYLKMFKNRKKRSYLYTKWEENIANKIFFYFPLHVELDYSLTIRSPQYFNQLEVIEKIGESLPQNTFLYFKEHPASIGGFDQKKLNQILQKNPKLKLISPIVNSYKILDKAKGIITINSKVGAEAIAMGKKVFVLGDAIYSDSNLVEYAESVQDLISKINNQTIKEKQNKNLENESQKFFSYLWQHSYPCELYQIEPRNILQFKNFIINQF